MDQTIEDILYLDKLITAEQLAAVRQEHIGTGRSVEEIILAHGWLTPVQLLQSRAKLVGVAFIDLEGRQIPPEVLKIVSQDLANRYVLIPFAVDRGLGELSIAMKDPLDLQVINEIEKRSGGLRVRPFLGLVDQIKTAVNVQYSQNIDTEVTQAIEESPELKSQSADISKISVTPNEITTEAGIAKVVNTLLDFAVRARATDIHIEPLESKTRVRYRIDGILYEKLTLPKNVHDSLVARVKIQAQMKIDEKRLPQDGRFNFRANGEEVDLRVSSLPTVYGEKVVMRLLKKSGGVPSLPDLGLRGTALKNLEIAMLRPHGIILACGPTGSGKTTTLYSVISRINSSKVNIVTLEDPVEYQIAGVNQVQINPQAGLTFASGLRSFLRQDPNIIYVGEIRDEETADLAIQAALTGHLVFSTLHTNNSAGALPRLLDLKVEPFLLASSINAAIGQRVCRRICPKCKESYEPPEEILQDIRTVLGKLLEPEKIAGKFTLFRGRGCEDCGQTGYYGRIGIFEVLPVSEKIAKMVLERAGVNEIESEAYLAGMISLKQDGYLKAVGGITTLEEVLRVAQD